MRPPQLSQLERDYAAAVNAGSLTVGEALQARVGVLTMLAALAQPGVDRPDVPADSGPSPRAGGSSAEEERETDTPPPGGSDGPEPREVRTREVITPSRAPTTSMRAAQ